MLTNEVGLFFSRVYTHHLYRPLYHYIYLQRISAKSILNKHTYIHEQELMVIVTCQIPHHTALILDLFHSHHLEYTSRLYTSIGKSIPLAVLYTYDRGDRSTLTHHCNDFSSVYSPVAQRIGRSAISLYGHSRMCVCVFFSVA